MRAPPRGGAKGPAHPYTVLAVLGVVLVVLVGGVIALALRGQPPAAGPDRVALWLAQVGRPEADRRDMVLLVEERRAEAVLNIVVLPARLQVAGRSLALFPARGAGRQAVAALQQAVGRRVRYYAVMPEAPLAQLVGLAGGLAVDGRTLDGAAAVAYLFGEASVATRMERAPRLLLAVLEAAAAGRMRLGVGDLLALAGQVETDLPLLELPDRFARWAGYQARVAPAPGQPAAGEVWDLDLPALQGLLSPDP